MRRFQIIRTTTDRCQLIEVYRHGGLYREFSGLTCISDALRHLRRCCSAEFDFEIIDVR